MVKNLKNKKKKKGFTLIELIIVIAIIAILAAIAIPKFGQVRTKANISADIATAKNIQNAVLMMVSEDNAKPGEKFEEAALTTALGSKPVSKLDKANAFSASVENDGTVIVKIGTVQVYPEPTTTNEWYPAVAATDTK